MTDLTMDDFDDINTEMAKDRTGTKKKGKRNAARTFNLLLAQLLKASGGNAHAFEALTGELLTQVSENSLALASNDDKEGGLLGGSSKKDDSVDPETARKLAIADKLILVSGGLDGAEKNTAAYTSLLGDTQLRKFLFQTQSDVQDGKVFVMTDSDEPSRVILSSQHKTEQLRDKYRDAFEALLSELFGHVPGGDVSKQRSAGLTKITDLQNGSTGTTTPSEDQILAKLVTLTGVAKDAADEKLAAYVKRVITTTTGGNVEIAVYDRIASMIAYKRPAKQSDDDYKAAVMTELGNFATAYTTTWNELIDAAKHNKMDLTGDPDGVAIAKWLGTNLYALVGQVDEARKTIKVAGVPEENSLNRPVNVAVENLMVLVNGMIRRHNASPLHKAGGKLAELPTA